MSLADAIAYDTENVVFNAADFGEAADFQAAGVPATRVLSLWGRIEKADTGNGYIADTTTVHVLASDLSDFRGAIVPERGVASQMIRYPTALATREPWIVSDVSRLDAHVWELRVWKLPEAMVQGLGT